MFSTSLSSVYVSLSLFNQGVYGCPFHVFFQVSIPTRSSTDPGHGTRIDWIFLLLSPNVTEHRSLLVVFCFYFYQKSLSGPPWNEGHQPRVRHETSVFEVPSSGTTRNTVSTLILLIHLLHVLCTWYTGIAHHPALLTSW